MHAHIYDPSQEVIKSIKAGSFCLVTGSNYYLFVFNRRQNRVFNYLMEYLCLLLYSQKIHTNASLITMCAHVGLFPQSLVMSFFTSRGSKSTMPASFKMQMCMELGL